jgi:hypothetical protein
MLLNNAVLIQLHAVLTQLHAVLIQLHAVAVLLAPPFHFEQIHFTCATNTLYGAALVRYGT